jgi:hypothetical protein
LSKDGVGIDEYCFFLLCISEAALGLFYKGYDLCPVHLYGMNIGYESWFVFLKFCDLLALFLRPYWGQINSTPKTPQSFKCSSLQHLPVRNVKVMSH